MPDYVDPSVAEWVIHETDLMNSVWGPAETRGALAFVHIPPFVYIPLPQYTPPNLFVVYLRNIIKSLQPNLNNETNPGLNGPFNP